MNLIEIRELFKTASGRYDLVNDDLSDNGGDKYINEAVRWLDRRTNINRSWGTHPKLIASGTWITQFPTARAVRAVRIDNFGVCIVPPIEIMAEINTLEGKLPEALPSKCAVMATGRLEQPPGDPFPPSAYKSVFQAMEILSDTPEEVDTLIFNTVIPKGVPRMVSIIGMFYQRPLVEDNDTNYWSRNHHMLLVNAAVRQTYVTSGNKALLDIINAEIEKDIAVISMDRIEEDIYGASQMRSNF